MRAAALYLAVIQLVVLASSSTAQRINGRVIDASTRQPITAVTIRLMRDDRAVAAATSDSLGRFRIVAPAEGRYRVVASRIGYADARSAMIELPPDQTVAAELQMSSQAVEVAPLTLIAPRDRYLESKGFYERQQSGMGDFRTGEELRRRNPQTLVDVLRNMRGVKIQRISGWKQEVYLAGTNCLPQVVVDGITMRWGGKAVGTLMPLEELVSIGHVDGIEVYRGGSGAPTEFVGPNASCGVILIWTRHR